MFRTTDGGNTWNKVLYKDDKTGAIDLAVDPHNPNVMFAALYQVQRTPWSLESGGPGSGLVPVRPTAEIPGSGWTARDCPRASWDELVSAFPERTRIACTR